MSVLLQQNNAEIFRAVDGTAAPLLFKGGIPYDGESLFAVDTVGDVDHYHQGLPFTAEGRLAVEGAPPVTYNSGAAPITATGKLSTAIVVIPNLYVNAELNFSDNFGAPFDHTFPFEDDQTFMTNDPDGTGNIAYSNFNGGLRRCPLQFALEVNNPDLVVGHKYRLELEGINDSGFNYGAALSMLNISGLTVTASQRRLDDGDFWRKVFYEFVIDDAVYTSNIRFGCGTTSANEVQLIMGRCLLVDLTAAEQDGEVAEWNGGVPYTADGRVLITVEG
jgi:hypothetical protein